MAITLNYELQITGDCQNNSSGAVGLTIYGGTPNYTITWLLQVSNIFRPMS